MSGFAVLLRADGRPVEEEALDPLAAAMVYRGPDGTTVRTGDGIGMAHAAFLTGDPTAARPGLWIEAGLWVAADARLDDRSTLLDALAAAGDLQPEDAADERLLARAWRAWGMQMTSRLLGDFSFVVWDASRRELFAARDQMGVKPLYHAAVDGGLLVGNTLEGLRAHAAVSDRLDDHAIADYLMFGLNRHPERTSFADISRVPPAHTLRWRPGEPARTRRYWRLPVHGPLLRPRECLERFEEALTAAVADRVCGEPAAVLMSGGLDSTAVATLVADVSRRRGRHAPLTACTFVFDRLIDDHERAFARQAAAHLGIAHREVSLDDDVGADLWGPTAAWSAEPNELPASSRMVRRVRRVAPGVRVGYTGQGGDPALHVTPADAVHRVAADGWLRTAAAMARYGLRRGHLPRLGLRTHLRRRLRGRRWEHPPRMPPWLRPDLVERLALRDRHRELSERRLDPRALRPEAADQLGGPEWSFLFEWYDPGMTGFAVEYRHPLLDIRLLEVALRLPVIPWLVEKDIMRRALRRRLPESVLARRKAPLAGFPLHETLLQGRVTHSGLDWRRDGLAEFIDIERFAGLVDRPERLHPWESELITRPLGLALWLSRLRAGGRGAMEVAGGVQQDGATQALP